MESEIVTVRKRIFYHLKNNKKIVNNFSFLKEAKRNNTTHTRSNTTTAPF